MRRMGSGAARPAAMPCRATAKSMSATSRAATPTSSGCRWRKRGTCSRAPGSTLPEQWIERGIGETRVVLVEAGEIVAARVLREDVIPVGTVLAARLVATGRLAVARAGDHEYLLPKGAPGVTEGAALTIEVTREALAGAEPWKRPLARVTDSAPAP